MKKLARLGLLFSLAFLLAPPGIAGAHAQGAPLDDDGLLKTLTNMGYAPSHLSKGYLLTIKSGTWTTYVQVVLSDDKSRIGYNANMGTVDEASVTAAQWQKLLEANSDYDPFAFYYDAKQKKIYYHFSMENRDPDPAVIKHYLDEFVQDIQDTESIWNFVK